MQKLYLRRIFILLCLWQLFIPATTNAGPCPDSVRITSVTNATCIGPANGSAIAFAYYGGPGFKYTWSTNPIQTNATATGLSAGTYTVSVTDTNHCLGSTTVTIGPLYEIYRIAGDTGGTSGYGGNGGQATAAKLNGPLQITKDAVGNLYIADHSNSVVRKVNTNGIISTIAGNHTHGAPTFGGQATATELESPTGLAVDSAGNIYISDSDTASSVYKVDAGGIISIFAGTGVPGYSGDTGPATSAQLRYPSGLCIYSGSLYICDASNSVIRKVVLTTNKITTVAGVAGFQAYNSDNIPATAAYLNVPNGVAFDASGNMYIADYQNNSIRRVDHITDTITTVVGASLNAGFSGDGGPAVAAELHSPWEVAFDPGGNMFISDEANHRIREVSTNGIITTVAGTGASGFSGDGGFAIQAKLNFPVGIMTDANYNVYCSDLFEQSVRELYACPQCSVTTHIATNLTCNTDTNGAITAVPAGGISPFQYSWNSGTTLASASGLKAGTYTVTLTDAVGCIATATTTLTGASINAVITGPDSLCKGDVVTLTASGGTTYKWNNNTPGATINVGPLSDTTYSVKVFSGPCSDTVSHTIYVASDGSICTVKFYHGFTPNGDGHNDTWIIDNIELFPGNTVEIYDRWGSQVWNGTGYNNTTVVWKGQDHRNLPLSSGTYYYIVKLNNRTYDGWVQITR